MTWWTRREGVNRTRIEAYCDELRCTNQIGAEISGGAGPAKRLLRREWGWVLTPYVRGSVAYCPAHAKIPLGGKEKVMSTNDVPGHKPENHDQLAMGSWAKHDDGSLIFVQSVENNRVVYMLFDMSRMPPRRWQGAMDEKKFKEHFSWDPKKPGLAQIKWTWHDKTPFPWEDVMEEIDESPMVETEGEMLSAAARVAEALGLRAEAVKREDFAHRGEQTRPGTEAGTEIMRRFKRALDAFFEDLPR